MADRKPRLSDLGWASLECMAKAGDALTSGDTDPWIEPGHAGSPTTAWIFWRTADSLVRRGLSTREIAYSDEGDHGPYDVHRLQLTAAGRTALANRHVPTPRPRGDDHHNSRVSEEQLANMRWQRARGWKCKEIAREYGLHPDSVSRLLSGRGRITTPEAQT